MGTGHGADPWEAAAAPLVTDSQAAASYQHIFKDFKYLRYLQGFSSLPGNTWWSELGLRSCKEIAQDAKTNTGSIGEAQNQPRAISALEAECQENRHPKPAPLMHSQRQRCAGG